MTFSESVRTCLREKYATFSGRASRSEYWWFFLAVTLAGMVLFGLMFLLGGGLDQFENNQGGIFATTSGAILGIVLLIFYLAILIPSIAVAVRRFHDRNLSGWWYLGLMVLGFVPFVGFLASLAIIVIAVLKGTPGPNKFGPDPLGAGDEEIFS